MGCASGVTTTPPPALIVPAMIIRQQLATMMKQQHAAQHVTAALIADDIWTSPLITNGNTEMMTVEAPIVRYPRLRPGKHKNPRLSIATDFIAGESRPTFRAIQHDTGRAAATTKNLDLITPSAYQPQRTIRDEDRIFIDARPNIDLVMLCRFTQDNTWRG